MNDRYLFRAKRTDNGEWVEGYYAFIDNNHYIYTGNLCNGGLYVVAERLEIDIATLCACTGLKDKNGNLIWENDIVKDNVIFGSVSWDDINARFVIDDVHDGYQDYSDWWHEVQVIGNIFDNPELLEVGE